ncbi:hypothetical protein [Parahaliea mediterranea]|uniref:hypothetical protein n=1 Tax=Parahaliea mediterranea TaxID=651086 RepID=UPI0013002909|nr:hypothetical protein [Parahaliea mediterranea]
MDYRKLTFLTIPAWVVFGYIYSRLGPAVALISVFALSSILASLFPFFGLIGDIKRRTIFVTGLFISAILLIVVDVVLNFNSTNVEKIFLILSYFVGLGFILGANLLIARKTNDEET